MKRTIAVTSAVALLVVGTAFVVRAQTTEGIPPCADLTDGGGTYSPPAVDEITGIPESAGKLSWTMDLAAPSCPDVQYGLTVYLNGPDGDPAVTPAGAILGSATTVGDEITQAITFQLELNDPDGEVCVVQTTFGAPTSSTSSKTGAAFDADGPGSVLLDRGPDLPSGGDVPGGGDITCIAVDEDGSGSRSAG